MKSDMIKTTRNPTPHKLGYQLSSNKGFSFLNLERSEIPRRCNLHRRGCASMAPQAPSKQTVTHTFCENCIPLPPKKKKKIVFLHQSGLKSHCYCCKHPPHFHPTMPCTHTNLIRQHKKRHQSWSPLQVASGPM